MGNLARLGLIEFTYDGEVERRWYDEMEGTRRWLLYSRNSAGGAEVVVERGVMMRTMLGRMFIGAVGETSGAQANVSHVPADP